jgi:hypothetical protein
LFERSNKMEDKEYADFKELLADAETCARLTSYEENFIASMKDKDLRWGKRLDLTPRQQDVLEDIRRKVYA